MPWHTVFLRIVKTSGYKMVLMNGVKLHMYQGLTTAAVIVAAGKGKRMGTQVSKQFLEINGKPILAYTLDVFEHCPFLDRIVLVTAVENIEYCKREIVERYGFTKVKQLIPGGSERQFSVYNGLLALKGKTDLVLIHDGVRPFVKQEDILKTVETAAVYDACVLGVPVKDTIKVCDEETVITDTPRRDTLWSIQTPQTFRYKLICDAYEKAIQQKIAGTDDSMLAEKNGTAVRVAMGSYDNIKITTMEDLYLAEFMVRRSIETKSTKGGETTP